MRRLLIAFALIASFAFLSAPAVAQEDPGGSSELENPSETTEPTQDPPPPPPPPEEPPPTSEPTSPSTDQGQGSGGGQGAGTDQGSGGGQGAGSNEGSGTGEMPATEQVVVIDDVVEAGQAALDSLMVIFAAQIQVSICHFPDGNPGNPQFITIGNPAVLAAHLKNHDLDFVANSAADCLGGPQEPGENDPKVTICHFPPGNPDNVQFISISVNALDAHLAHGDFIADDDDECFDDDDGDDGDDGDEGDDEGDEDGDDDKVAALPDTGGPSQWNLAFGLMLTAIGMVILLNRESLIRTGLFGPVPADAVPTPWSPTVFADVQPETLVKPETHLGRWTALGVAALVAAVVVGRRAKS